jgi:transcriptional regulator with XRE-family HTH domain
MYLILSKNDKSQQSSQMNTSFGEYIRKLRTDNNLTLTQLAAKLSMDSANLSKVENGKRNFDEKRLQKLAQTFSLNLRDLKEEYFSDKFAKTIYENHCSDNILILAEKKVKYLIQKNSNQTKLDF